jgi:hypothetical protein
VGDDDGRTIPEQHAAELGCFYQDYAQWLFGYAYLRTRRDQDLAAASELAADLVQDTFEAAARDWGTVRVLRAVAESRRVGVQGVSGFDRVGAWRRGTAR